MSARYVLQESGRDTKELNHSEVIEALCTVIMIQKINRSIDSIIARGKQNSAHAELPKTSRVSHNDDARRITHNKML